MIDPEIGITQAESLAKSGLSREAADAFAKLVDTGQSNYRIHHGYALTLMRSGQHELARGQFREALSYEPNSIAVLSNLAVLNTRLGNPCAAEAMCRKILGMQSNHHPAWSNLGSALCQQGRISEGIEAFQKALDLVPDDRIICDNLLLNLNYLATDGRELAEVHRILCNRIPARPRKPRSAEIRWPMRVGYVSSDFRSHPVSFFMAGIIGTHDRKGFEIFCYSTTSEPDGRTENFRTLADHFVDLSTFTDAEAAKRIEEDRIDILIDLGGHTSGNPLGIFALRPAAVQASYLGYPATTGCSFIDYRVVDALTDPEGSASLSTERLIRLPAPFLSYNPHSTSPKPSPLPALSNGYITFGSFNNSSKISEDTLNLWCRVLSEVSDSRMFLKARAFSDEVLCDRLRDQFHQRGIHPSRITFSGILEDAQDHLAAYRSVDIALDTFPYNGTTTTCEALWMGVPVITLVGSLHAARVGLTLLTAVGLQGLAATSLDSFVGLSCAFSEDTNQLAQLRGNLRRIVKHSPLCDHSRLTRGLEDAYRQMLAVPFPVE